MGKDDDNYLFKDLASSTGGNHHSKMYTVTVVSENDTEVVVEYACTKRYPIQELEQARRDYEILNGSGLILTLDHLLNIKKHGSSHPKKDKL